VPGERVNPWLVPEISLGSRRIHLGTLPELEGRLLAELNDPLEIARAFQLYTYELTLPLSASRSVAEKAIQLREASPSRLPLVDSVIAATAACYGAILVHSDSHMPEIPEKLVRQIYLLDL
jgi:predicted nucleic acid-binding protein